MHFSFKCYYDAHLSHEYHLLRPEGYMRIQMMFNGRAPAEFSKIATRLINKPWFNFMEAVEACMLAAHYRYDAFKRWKSHPAYHPE